MLTQNELISYIKGAYPLNLRGADIDENSVIYKYDLIRAFTMFTLNQNVEEAVNRLFITTSDVEGIRLWEEFLGINEDLSKTIDERRGSIIALLTGNNETISIAKQIVFQVTGGDENSIKFKEYWKEPGVLPDELFTYEVEINNSGITKEFSIQNLYNILVKIQPLHCTLIITLVQNLLDNIGINDTIITSTHSDFNWGGISSLSGDGFYADISNPLDGELWS